MIWWVISVVVWIGLGLWGAKIFDQTYAKIAATHRECAQKNNLSSEKSEATALYLAGALLGPIIFVASLYNSSYSREPKAEEKSKADKHGGCTKEGCGCSREGH